MRSNFFSPELSEFVNNQRQRLADEEAPAGEGLRERKKRITRQLISDTATWMVLQHGYEAVRVADVARACEVSEKTVFNYFPTKESLIFDREPEVREQITEALALRGPNLTPVQAAVQVLEKGLERIYARHDQEHKLAKMLPMMQRFGELINETPALRAAQSEMLERLIDATAEALAEGTKFEAYDPEPQTAAAAIVGLWSTQFRAMRRHALATQDPDELFKLVAGDLHRAAALIDGGLAEFGSKR